MSAGAWVFPVTVVAFICLIAGFTFSVAPKEDFDRIESGDTVVLEYTGFYDEARAYAYHTTRKDLADAGKLNVGPHPIGVSDAPIVLTIPPGQFKDDGSLYGYIIGRRVNETFSTPHLHGFFGQWDGQRELPLDVEYYDPHVTFKTGDTTPTGAFNYAGFVGRWTQTLGHPLVVGDEVPCEGGLPWDCRIVSLDATTSTVQYDRIPVPAGRVPAETFVPFVGGTPLPQANFTVRTADNGTLVIAWELEADDAFVLSDGIGPWAPGAYSVDRVIGGTAHVHYARLAANPDEQAAAQLIGQTIWFQFQVISIQHP